MCGLALCSSACAILSLETPSEHASEAEVTGQATYRERIALPDGAYFSVTLEDVSRADAKAEIIGGARFALKSGPPIPFSISYDPARIKASNRYAVRAHIEHDGRLLFATDTHYPVLTHQAPDTVELLLKRVSLRAAATAEGKPTTLYGMYSYTADSGLFHDCASGQRMPVAEEGDNAALQSAYVKAVPQPGAPLLAAVEGRIETRQPMEGNPRPTLIVDRFLNIKAGTCESGSSASLENTYWKVTAINGAPVEVAERQREAHVILHPADKRVSGRGGCNALMGSYELKDDQIRFMRMAGTLMACPQGMEQEQALFKALGTVVRWQIAGEQLQLMNNQDTVVVELVSRYLY